MKKRKIIPYNPKLKEFARKLRKDSTFTDLPAGRQEYCFGIILKESK